MAVVSRTISLNFATGYNSTKADFESAARAAMIATDPTAELLSRQFAIAESQESATLRFVMLYGILLQIVGDIQSRVDDGISWRRASITRDAVRNETVYTRLRNELMHPHDRGTDYARTEREIGGNIGTFAEIVREILRTSTQ